MTGRFEVGEELRRRLGGGDDLDLLADAEAVARLSDRPVEEPRVARHDPADDVRVDAYRGKREEKCWNHHGSATDPEQPGCESGQCADAEEEQDERNELSQN